ncbi:hypothetical protein [Marinobacter sp.]|uniref:hypothetical protein n=1 Tax=Marinobacter sp. TaxID=50741 RepID=UPI0035661877
MYSKFPFLLIYPPFIYGALPVFFYSYFGYQLSPSLDHRLLSLVDLFGSLIIAIFFLNYKRLAVSSGLFERFQFIFSRPLFSCLIILSCLVLVFEGWKSVELIQQGFDRDDLKEFGRVSALFLVLGSLACFFLAGALWLDSKMKYALLFGVLGAMLITASRSEILLVAYFVYILLFFSGPINYKKYILYIIAVLFAGSFFTILVQGRGGGVIIALEKFFQYRTTSLFLAEYSISEAAKSPDIIFPFLGRYYDQMANLFGSRSTISSSFHIDYVYMGYNEKYGYHMWANVVYPWWSWFYGYFGLSGFLFKFSFISFLLWFFVNLRFYFTFVFFMVSLVWISQTVHPLLSSKHAYLFLFLFIIDLIFVLRVLLVKMLQSRRRIIAELSDIGAGK